MNNIRQNIAKHRFHNLIITLFILLLITTPIACQADIASETNPQMHNEEGITITDNAPNGVSGSTIATDGSTIIAHIHPPSPLTRADYQKVYEQAQALLTVGETFRQTRLQLPPACTTPEECQINYQDFNDGELFFAFCSDYDQVDIRGYCHQDTPTQWPMTDSQIRGQLVRAREMFGFLALAEPANIDVIVDGQPVRVRELGRSGVLTATREIANIHMIFGNEFLVDAIDYRFGGHNPNADLIIAEELEQLTMALQQFKLAVGVLAHAFNADFGGPNGGYIGDYFGVREFALFGLVSERMVLTIGEMADRHRQLGQDQKALDLYANAFVNQYVQAAALAINAKAQDQAFLENGGYEIINNLERLRNKAQTIHNGINPFGYVDNYVPLDTYEELRLFVKSELLRDATEDELNAANSQREFDRNRTELAREMRSLRLTYNTRLQDICGPSQDNYATCFDEGGLMSQNYYKMLEASEELNLIEQRQQNLLEQVEIEQERADTNIQLTLESGETIAATAIARGAINAVRTTDTHVDSTTDHAYAGGEDRVSMKFSADPRDVFSFQRSLFVGYRHEETQTSSVQIIWDPAQKELADLESAQALQQAVNQADIIGTNSTATIRNLLLQTSELAIQKNIRLQEMNRLFSEHNDLVNQYNQLLNLREQARADLVDSHLANPAFRILRDQTTIEAARSHKLAAHFAYLTAKALEYEFLLRFPKLNDIYKARTADDIDNFMNELEIFRFKLSSPGEREHIHYEISMAKYLLGSPTPEEFRQLLQRNLVRDDNGKVIGLKISFATSLLDNAIFSQDIWNNRIAGVDLPQNVSHPTKGVWIDLMMNGGPLIHPQIQLTHSGHASYRTATREIIEYVPENAQLVDDTVPEGFGSKTKTAVILAGVNGDGEGTYSSSLLNRSVAASNWTLYINLTSPSSNKNLALEYIDDIVIYMDTTGIGLPPALSILQPGHDEVQSVEQHNISLSTQPDSTFSLISTLADNHQTTTDTSFTGSYLGFVRIDEPTPMGVLDLAFDVEEIGGLLNGQVNPVRTQVFLGGPSFTGHIDSSSEMTPTFELLSETFSSVVSGRTIERQFILVGEILDDGNVLQGEYIETIIGFKPAPMEIRGQFSLSRPSRYVEETNSATPDTGSTAMSTLPY